MDWLSRKLINQSDLPVTNGTGLAGQYDYSLYWAGEFVGDNSGPSLFSALESQLGLRLLSKKVVATIIVIDPWRETLGQLASTRRPEVAKLVSGLTIVATSCSIFLPNPWSLAANPRGWPSVSRRRRSPSYSRNTGLSSFEAIHRLRLAHPPSHGGIRTKRNGSSTLDIWSIYHRPRSQDLANQLDHVLGPYAALTLSLVIMMGCAPPAPHLLARPATPPRWRPSHRSLPRTVVSTPRPWPSQPTIRPRACDHQA